uniref:Uncharacterized protein n=1 Tax=Rhipicephalus microplus TaxID=6941 RepID=A0A6G5A2F5_RHIMP
MTFVLVKTTVLRKHLLILYPIITCCSFPFLYSFQSTHNYSFALFVQETNFYTPLFLVGNSGKLFFGILPHTQCKACYNLISLSHYMNDYISNYIVFAGYL